MWLSGVRDTTGSRRCYTCPPTVGRVAPHEASGTPE